MSRSYSYKSKRKREREAEERLARGMALLHLMSSRDIKPTTAMKQGEGWIPATKPLRRNSK